MSYVRDTTLCTDACRTRNGSPPPVMAVLANIAIPALWLLGAQNLKVAMSDCKLHQSRPVSAACPAVDRVALEGRGAPVCAGLGTLGHAGQPRRLRFGALRPPWIGAPAGDDGRTPSASPAKTDEAEHRIC